MSRFRRLNSVLPVASLAVAVVGATLLPAQNRPAPPEVHVVGIHGVERSAQGNGGAGEAAVRVDRPDKDVILVLCAYEPVTWAVSHTPQTRLAEVVVGGYYRQTVRGLPDTVRVFQAFAEGRWGQPSIRGCYDINSPGFRPMVRQVHEFVGAEIASFQGAGEATPGRPFVVDRVQDDPRLRSDYPRPVPFAQLPKLRFRAVYVYPDDHLGVASYGNFTLLGPERLTLKPLPDRTMVQVAEVPNTSTAYGLAFQGAKGCISELDLARGTAKEIAVGPDGKTGSLARAIAYDPKSDRLLVLTLDKHLYALDRATGVWSGRPLRRAPYQYTGVALAHHTVADALFVLAVPPGEAPFPPPELWQLDSDGAVARRNPLGEPLFPGAAGCRSGHPVKVQLLATGDSLVLLAYPIHDSPSSPMARDKYIFLIDPKSGAVRVTWRGE